MAEQGRDLVRVGIDSGRALVLDSKLLGKLLKVSHFGSTYHSAKMNRTVIVRRNYLHYVNKYQSSHIPKLQCQGRGPCGHWPVQAIVEDCKIHCFKRHSSGGGKKAFTAV